MNIRELAGIAGLSKSTVAYALKDDPRIRAEVRERVRQLAKEHGYRPSPTVNAFMNEVRKNAVRQQKVSMACLLGGQHTHDRPTYEQEMINAAEAQASQMGYCFEAYFWESEALPQARLQSILLARGVKGIYIGTGHSIERLQLDWDRFCVVASGYHIKHLDVDRFAADLHQSMTHAIEQALARGYEKVVVAINDLSDLRVGRRWLSGAMTQQKLYGSDRIEVQLRDWENASQADVSSLAKQPRTAIISHGVMIDWLRKGGVSIPEDVAFVSLDKVTDQPEVTAILQPHAELGQQAIFRLAFLMEHGQWGVPKLPTRLTLECGWHEGRTLPEL